MQKVYINNEDFCRMCERKKTEYCENCTHKGTVYNREKRPDYFLLNRHFTIIEMIDKYCCITDTCENCKVVEFCELYVVPDIITKASKIKKSLSTKTKEEIKKIVDKNTFF